MLLIIFKFSFESESRLRENLWTHTCILNIGKKKLVENICVLYYIQINTVIKTACNFTFQSITSHRTAISTYGSDLVLNL